MLATQPRPLRKERLSQGSWRAVSQAGLRGSEQKADSSECCRTDPAWKSPEPSQSFLSGELGGECPLFLCYHIWGLAAQQDRPSPDWGPCMEGALGCGRSGLHVARSCYRTSVCCLQALSGRVCIFGRTIVMAPGLWAVSEVVLAKQDSS